MTVLNQIIEKVKTFSGDELHPENLINFLKANLKAEERQIRVTYGAGRDFEYSQHFRTRGEYPDIETYITKIKK